MNALELLKTAAPHILDQHGVQIGGLHVESLPTKDAVEALDHLRSFIETQQATGWLRWLDHSETLAIQQVDDLGQGGELPYCGEFVAGDGTASLHLRFGDGRYTVQKLNTQSDSDGLLVTERRLGANAAAKQIVCYQVHWQLDKTAEPAAYHPATARFAGFEHA